MKLAGVLVWYNTMTITEPLLSGKLYPNKKFCVYFNRRKKKRSEDKRYDRERLQQPDVDYGSVADYLTGVNSIDGKFCSVSEASLFIKGQELSREKKPTYGSKGITKYGRRVVENTCVLLERKYGKERLGFVTCTLPSLPKAIHHRLNGVWGEVVRRFYQKLKRQLEKVSKPFVYVGVTEIQEKRYKRTGVPAPHLHFVYLCRDSSRSRYWLYVCQIHRAWNQAVREGINLCGYPYTMSQLPGWGSVHCKRVQKSASAYLGKYMSKGGKVLESMREAGWTEFPKQWWTASMQCKKWFKESIVDLGIDVCKMLFYQLGDCIHERMIDYAQYVDVLMGNEYKCAALVGVLSSKGYWLLKDG